MLEVFIRGDKDRSLAAAEFVEKHYGDRTGVIVVVRDVAVVPTALERFHRLAETFKVEERGLPAFYVSGQFRCGWNPDNTPGWLQEQLTIEFFSRTGCPRCAAATPVIYQWLAPRYPGFVVVEQDLAKSADAGRRLQELAERYRTQATSVPAVHLCGRLMIGFLSPEASFQQWDQVLQNVTLPTPVRTSQGDSSSIPRRKPSDPREGRGFGALYAGEPPLESAPLPTLPNQSPGLDSEVLAPQVDLPPDADAAPVPSAGASTLPPELDDPGLPILEPLDASPASDTVTLPLVGEVNWRSWGLPAFTIAVGLIDGFNPCAMWVLLFLLSLLVNLRDRWKILAVAGTFVAISGLAYLAFMAAWLNVFQLVGLLRPAQIALGLLAVGVGAIHIKDFFALHKGVSLSIPDSAKPRLYERMRKIVLAETLLGAIIGASVLAVLVNVVELLCTAGLPAMYTGILTMQALPTWQNYLYLLLYIAAYMFDDALMVAIVVITLGKTRLQEQGGRLLKLLNGLVILVLGVVMLFKPEWLV
ncbi:MAG: thioredoxin family protein [Planctomycetaceae bacterium]|nr:thioredoxin family protein [Planctomycetaceae bacterium]